MILKSRSPTMRHVSITHTVALDSLFDRINLDSKIQIKYIDTKNQLADINQREFHTWWVESSVEFVEHQPFQLYSLHRCNGKTSSTRIKRRTCHSQVATHEEFDREDAFVRVFFNFIKPGDGLVRIPRSWKSVASDDRSEKPANSSPPCYSKRIMVDLGLPKSGKVELRSTIDQGNLRKLLEIWCNKLSLIVKNPFSTEMCIPQSTERWFMIDRGNLINWITKKRQPPKLSSWAVTQQNLWTKSETKCEFDRKECQALQ